MLTPIKMETSFLMKTNPACIYRRQHQIGDLVYVLIIHAWDEWRSMLHIVKTSLTKQAAIQLKTICCHLPELLASMPAAGLSSPTNVDFHKCRHIQMSPHLSDYINPQSHNSKVNSWWLSVYVSERVVWSVIFLQLHFDSLLVFVWM